MKKILCILSALTLVAVLLIFPLAAGESESLITKGYIDTVLLPQIQEMIKSSKDESGGTDSFSVISLKAGSCLICDSGCEMIIRMGTANIIATDKGGVSDVTSGIDLPKGVSAPANHHLIVPVADGRGLLAHTDMLVMVKGGYTIK